MHSSISIILLETLHVVPFMTSHCPCHLQNEYEIPQQHALNFSLIFTYFSYLCYCTGTLMFRLMLLASSTPIKGYNHYSNDYVLSESICATHNPDGYIGNSRGKSSRGERPAWGWESRCCVLNGPFEMELLQEYQTMQVLVQGETGKDWR